MKTSKTNIVYPKLPANGMALWPFVLVKRRELLSDPVLLNHERIHLRQQLEMLVVPFYLAYLGAYLWHYWVRGRSAHHAYRAIPFEREAYAMEQNQDYLKGRPLWAFLRYWNNW